jgi:ABC-2 type transport system permease protein
MLSHEEMKVMQKALIIMFKDISEIVQQPLLLLGILLPPLLFTAIPVFIISQAGHMSLNSTSGNTAALSSNPALAGLTAQEMAQALPGLLFSTFYLLLPGIITSVIASYSVVGEKTSRTLEPILGTPIRTWELLLGKCLASLVPGIGVTWLSGLILIVAMAVFSLSHRVFAAVISPGWLVLLLLWAPLLAIIANAVMIAVSSRVNEPRTAQQVSAWLIIPVLGIFFGQLAGVQVFGPIFTLIVAIILAVLAFLSMWGATAIFQREVILTRWK